MGREIYLTDGGIETDLIFHRGQDLPHFAAFDLLKTAAGRAALEEYFREYAELARKLGLNLILESPTWRASPDWAAKLGYSEPALIEANFRAIAMLKRLRKDYESPKTRVLVSGCVGPRGDGYQPSNLMSPEEAERYHSFQIGVFATAAVDRIAAITINYVEEAIGIARAAAAVGLPAVIAFTVETDGRLPTGQTIGSAIEAVDRQAPRAPAHYMINCAHPNHFAETLAGEEPWLARIQGLRANASAKSHAELNDSPELDEGDPAEFGRQHGELFAKLKNLRVLGGCCGTDLRHVEAAVRAARAFA
ncbi:MAG TPA: homocysteine S-methyltransferase family protein [bacterium]|nr:homocysteine S-methyltransferase family protein [bacterium]